MPELVPPVDASTQARFDEGHRVGSLAKTLFPGGLEIGPGVRQWDRVVADTQRALTQRRPLYEAAFRAAGGACRVDILVPVNEDKWDVCEVKSSTHTKDTHISDLALQAHVLEASGLRTRDFFVVHLDNTYVRRGSIDPKDLFHRGKVTEKVRERQQGVVAELAVMQRTLELQRRPEIPIGRHCTDPYECPLKDGCWAFLPPGNVLNLTGGMGQGLALLEEGILELGEISLDSDLKRRQRIQVEAVRSGTPHVDREALRQFLQQLVYPIYYFDIETFASAIPLFDDSRPYQQIPFLFSVHRVERSGEEARHFTFLYNGLEDPRPDFLRAVRNSLEDEGSIVAYNAPFEKRVLRDSADAALRELVPWFEDLDARFVDLLNPFRDFAYHHPEQNGSASLKSVLGPLTGLSYAEMEIADGERASREYLRLSASEVDPIERARVLRQLEEYCSMDTWAMVAIVESLRDLTS